MLIFKSPDLLHIFYTPDISGNIYTLSEQESKHAVRVLRVKHGDEVMLTNGLGTIYHANIADPHPKRCSLSVVSSTSNYGKNPYSLHIAIAPTKNIDRLEWFLEKVTEIGIDEITPILSFHSERKVIKDDRLDKVIIAAMKQSIKGYKPVLNPLTSFSDFLKKDHTGKLCIAHCKEGDKTPLKSISKTENRLTILIGPEGDFSEQEIKEAMHVGAIPISLGESRLRTETAGIVACHTVNLMNANF